MDAVIALALATVEWLKNKVPFATREMDEDEDYTQCDRQYFREHPEVVVYRREARPDEEWQGCMIEVRQVMPGVRLRRPVA